MLSDEPVALSAEELQAHRRAVSLAPAEATPRFRFGRLAIAALAATSIVALLVALNSRSTVNFAEPPSASLGVTDEVRITFSSVDIQTQGPHWDAEYQLPEVPLFYSGTWADGPAGPLARCIGRGNSAGCNNEANAVTLLVGESSGIVDTIVWHGLSANTSYVVLEAEGITRWQFPVNDVAAFPTTWCTADECTYTLTAYDSDGRNLATASD
ncbi:MAG: hypothetical protein Q8M22_06410 [Actinomycetota bacterium]|nr:hypothetical protein [Actinomycetota bacterium]